MEVDEVPKEGFVMINGIVEVFYVIEDVVFFLGECNIDEFYGINHVDVSDKVGNHRVCNHGFNFEASAVECDWVYIVVQAG